MTIINIPWYSDEETKWSNEDSLNMLLTDTDLAVFSYVNYFLWESTAESLVDIGLPTYADVRNWLQVLYAREDAVTSEKIKIAISCCETYLAP